MSKTEFATSIVEYLKTRKTPWLDKTEMAEAVEQTIDIVLGDSAYTTARLLPEWAIRDRLGQSDWKYDVEMDMHIPCCTQRVGPLGRKCGNGPLTGEQIRIGNCGEH